jgi:hypothetical protein
MSLYLLFMAGMYCGGLATAITAPRSRPRLVRLAITTAILVWTVCLYLTLP